jgi:hypothetical protein
MNMRKLLIVLLALCFVFPAMAQVKVVTQQQLFSTNICTLTGIAGSPTANHFRTDDSSFAWSNNINMTVTTADGITRLADRAWLELTIDDTGAGGTATHHDVLDSQVVYMYGVGANAALSESILDTLLFVYGASGKITALDVYEECLVTPLVNTFENGGITMTRKIDMSLLTSDSTHTVFEHLPYQVRFKLCADGSVASFAQVSAPFAEDYDDSLMVQMRLILQVDPSPKMGF